MHRMFIFLHSHLQTNYSKTFQRGNVDFLETPEIITTMLVPGKSADVLKQYDILFL